MSSMPSLNQLVCRKCRQQGALFSSGCAVDGSTTYTLCCSKCDHAVSFNQSYVVRITDPDRWCSEEQILHNLSMRFHWPFPSTTTTPLTITELLEESHATAVEKGWWEGGRSFGDQTANFHAEISEAWEEYRKFGLDKEKFIYCDKDKPEKPEGLAVELADVLIRIGDTCAKYGIPLEEAIRLKWEYNKTRGHRHAGKKA